MTFEKDGEFWMSFQDWVQKFDRLEVCLINPDTLPKEDNCNKRWEMSVFEGEWTRGVTAGGCRNYLGNIIFSFFILFFIFYSQIYFVI